MTEQNPVGTSTHLANETLLDPRGLPKGDRRQVPIQFSGTKTFLVGLCSGALLVANWRFFLKGSIKAAIRGASKVQEVAVRGAENVSDIAHEALIELHSAEQTPLGKLGGDGFQ